MTVLGGIVIGVIVGFIVGATAGRKGAFQEGKVHGYKQASQVLEQAINEAKKLAERGVINVQPNHIQRQRNVSRRGLQ